MNLNARSDDSSVVALVLIVCVSRKVLHFGLLLCFSNFQKFGSSLEILDLLSVFGTRSFIFDFRFRPTSVWLAGVDEDIARVILKVSE